MMSHEKSALQISVKSDITSNLLYEFIHRWYQTVIGTAILR